jgi:peptidoglycan/LPS O-acetylase OafA/YrhL
MNKDIEILRAYSILFVLIEHAPAITGIPGIETFRTYMNGWTGVDLFFAISGFVIYRSLHGRIFFGMRTSDAISEIVAFWIRRFWRLAPAAWFWLAMGILVIITYNQQEIGLKFDNFTDLLASVLNFQNFHRFYCNVNHDVCGRLFPHYWSLSLETQFYLVLPLVVILAPARYLTLGLFFLILLQFPIKRPANADELAWFIRTDALAWGVLIGKLSFLPARSLVEPKFLSSHAARVAFTAFFLFALGTSQYFWRESFFVGLVALLSALLVFAASFDRKYIARLCGPEAMLVWLGQRSYSVYVAHMLIFKVVREICQAIGFYDSRSFGRFAYLVLAYGLTLIFAAASYKWIETPLRRRGRAYAADYLIRTRVTPDEANPERTKMGVLRAEMEVAP